MEEIIRGLESRTCHSSTVLQVVSSLYTKIKTGAGDDRDAGVKLVWQHLGSESVLVSQACGDLVTLLVKTGLLDTGSTITQLLSCLSQGLEYTGIIPTLGAVLCHQAQCLISRHGQYPPDTYMISSHQHPLISVLRSTPAAWTLVLDQCLTILRHETDVIRDNAVVMLKPVLLYLYCDPNHHLHFGAMRATLLDIMLDLVEDNEDILKFIVYMIDWIKLDNKASLHESAHLIHKMFDWSVSRGQVSILVKLAHILPSLAYYQVKHGYSPHRPVSALTKLLDLSDDREDVVISWDCVMILLHQILDTAPLTHHTIIVSLATALLPHVSQVSAAVVVVTCLQSLHYTGHLPGHCVEDKAQFVRTYHKTPWSDATNKMRIVQVSDNISDSLMLEAVETLKIIMTMSGSEEKTVHWLSSLTPLPHSHLSRSYPLLTALFLVSSCSAAAQLSLQLLLTCVSADPSLSTPLLSLILHKLASDSGDADIKLSLLHALPSMAADRTCISLIIKLVSSFSTKPSFASLRLNLLYRLWRLESRAYPFLQKALLEPVPQSFSLEVQTTQAVVIRDILRSEAVQLGSDLLPVLSNILNQCSSPESATAAVIALDGISHLLKHSVIDMKTTIKVLAPKCSRDKRPSVLQGYIKLLGLAPAFKLTGTEYQNFLVDNVNWLWQTVTTSTHVGVVRSGYQSLGQYPLELTTLKMIPASARQGLRLPAKYCSTPADAARRPEDVLTYVPGECWAQLLEQVGDSESLLVSLVREEVTHLPRAIYSLSQAMQNAGAEPVNYSHLPEQSVLRGVVTWCQERSAARRNLPPHPTQLQENKTLVTLMRILSADHARPLPPLDWSFLEPLFSDADLRPGVISLLSRQAVSSRTAKMIVERQLRGEQTREVVMSYMNNLKLLVSSVSQSSMQHWLTRSLQTGLHAACCTGTSADMMTMLQDVSAALQDDNVGELGQAVIGQAMETIHDSVPLEDADLHQQYLMTASQLPVTVLERLSSPSVWWEVTDTKLHKAAGLRTSLALSSSTDTPLTWLNEIIEVAARQSGDQSYLLRHLVTLLTRCRAEHTRHMIQTWLLETMGHISSQLRSGGQVMFLMKVWSLTVTILSEADTLVSDRDHVTGAATWDLLPVSLSRLCQHHGNMSGQLADWCLNIVKNNNTSLDRSRDTMTAALRVFKDSNNWTEASMWGKLVMSGYNNQ